MPLQNGEAMAKEFGEEVSININMTHDVSKSPHLNPTLPNVKNIQASWLTVGKKVAQLCLHSGAND